MDFILATNNMKKLAEMQRILSPLGINVVTAKMLGIQLPDVVEDGDTFEANAKIKALSACKITNMPAIADDSGLCVDYLGGAPGIYSARFANIVEHNGVNIDKYPDLKICTLDEYLECCKKYNMTAVIEFKGKNNTEHYDEVVASVKKSGATVAYISFHEECLKAMRKLTDADMFFLSQIIDDDAISVAKSIENCGLDFNGNKEENFDNDSAPIKNAAEAGLTLGAWTIDDTETMQKLLNLGVDYITTDNITY